MIVSILINIFLILINRISLSLHDNDEAVTGGSYWNFNSYFDLAVEHSKVKNHHSFNGNKGEELLGSQYMKA